AAMLLSVSVWAGNPENVPMCNNVQNVITAEPLTAPEVKEVQQTPCIIYVLICGQYRLFNGVYGVGCEHLAIALQTFIDNNVSCN
ncbi:MAG: hypothetical protein NZ455_14655, partial [Bacteroidia bacterium]|nr:hypothetical protein [Bacteroidia bacterium]